MRKSAFICIAAAGLILAGCGAREQLRPPPGQSMPAAPALSDRALTTDELLSVPSEFRPVRVDEPLTRSARRPVDPFDLPPPDVAGSTDADPSELEEAPAPAPADPPQ